MQELAPPRCNEADPESDKALKKDDTIRKKLSQDKIKRFDADKVKCAEILTKSQALDDDVNRNLPINDNGENEYDEEPLDDDKGSDTDEDEKMLDANLSESATTAATATIGPTDKTPKKKEAKKVER